MQALEKLKSITGLKPLKPQLACLYGLLLISEPTQHAILPYFLEAHILELMINLYWPLTDPTTIKTLLKKNSNIS